MEYKRYTYFIIGALLCSLLCLISVFYIVDPIGIWGSYEIQGFNQAKVKQGNYLDVYKPYEYARVQPDVIWIGTSRVYVGFAPYESANEYNLGMSSISLADVKKYLQFVYSVKKPSKVYVGLDLFQFGPEYKRMASDELVDKRLNAIKTGHIYHWAMAVKDSFGVKKTILPTMEDSRDNNTVYYQRGWDVKRGNADSINVDEYYASLNIYGKTYNDFSYDPEAMDCFRDIVKDAADNSVELVVFFNPITVDLQAMQDIYDISDDFYSIKKEVASIHPVYDFCWVNEYTIDRQKWFYDASHFRDNYGKMCRDAMNGDDNRTAIYLKSENVNEMIARERLLFDEWKIVNITYCDELSRRVMENISIGSLKKYIGF
ncbi:hypothetical protein [Anaerovibrio lipolyticus]|uniref:hypothetical protein n=1 Tax=Anaerovibrio lipolyticus TaxID=82374 RepID=UPI00047FE1A3|nr:hypothetical protein [Anaerovibrio lipolyticus]